MSEEKRPYYGRGSKGWGFLAKVARKYNSELAAHLQEEIERSEMSEEEAAKFVLDCLRKRHTHTLEPVLRPRLLREEEAP